MKRLPELQNARAANSTNRPLADNEVQHFDTLETEVCNLDTETQRAQGLDAMECATPCGFSISLANLDRATSVFCVGTFIAHTAGIPGAPDFAREAEVRRKYQRRSANADSQTIPFAALLPNAMIAALAHDE